MASVMNMNENIIKEICIDEIKASIPHRYPMLLVDKLVDVMPFTSAIGIKCVTQNEPYFQGHFPESPIMPGVLMIEAMAQTAAVLVVKSLGSQLAGKLVYFMSVDDARFRRPVVPGDQLYLEITKIHNRGNAWKFKGIAKVNKKVHAEATFTAMIMDKA